MPAPLLLLTLHSVTVQLEDVLRLMPPPLLLLLLLTLHSVTVLLGDELRKMPPLPLLLLLTLHSVTVQLGDELRKTPMLPLTAPKRSRCKNSLVSTVTPAELRPRRSKNVIPSCSPL